MTEVINFNLEDINETEAKTSQDRICISCLQKNVPFLILSNCEHAKVFDFLLDYKVEFIDSLICYKCHIMLKKVLDFKNQLNKSINKLYNESKQQQASKELSDNLQYSKIEINYTINSEPLIAETLEPTNFQYPFEIAIKLEPEQVLNHDNDIPLLEVKNEKIGKISKVGKVGKVKKVKKPFQRKFEGKIKVIMLTMEEMLEERQQEIMKPSFIKLPYKCDLCIAAFDYEENLKNHVEKRHKRKKGGLKCKICNSILGSQTSYEEHYKRHFKRHECVECGKRSSSVYTVLKHYNETHGVIKTLFSCKLCDFTTESHRVYRYHRDKDHKEKIECEVCGNTFVNSTGLRVHLFTVHGQSSRVHSCTHCGKVYRAKSGLLAHAAAKHGPASPAYCALCDTHFPTQLGLKNHLRHHSRHSQRRYACNECDAKFIVKKSLIEHIDWVHMNNTEHSCQKCKKAFKNSACLKKHNEFVHEKKRPPRDKICDHCGRGFTTLAILRTHVRTHTGERPLHCTHCAATFSHSAALYTHKKLLHSAERNKQ